LCNFVRQTVFNGKLIMKHEPQHLRESLWRRKLTDAERTELRARPEISADLANCPFDRASEECFSVACSVFES